MGIKGVFMCGYKWNVHMWAQRECLCVSIKGVFICGYKGSVYIWA